MIFLSHVMCEFTQITTFTLLQGSQSDIEVAARLIGD